MRRRPSGAQSGEFSQEAALMANEFRQRAAPYTEKQRHF
jgi:hypothetical protein